MEKIQATRYISLYRPSIGEIKENNRQAGQYFFSKNTMQFFGKQKMSIVLNEKKDGFFLKIIFLNRVNDKIKYYQIIDNGKELRPLSSYYGKK
jgi:hypothetical protein